MFGNFRIAGYGSLCPPKFRNESLGHDKLKNVLDVNSHTEILSTKLHFSKFVKRNQTIKHVLQV